MMKRICTLALILTIGVCVYGQKKYSRPFVINGEDSNGWVQVTKDGSCYISCENSNPVGYAEFSVSDLDSLRKDIKLAITKKNEWDKVLAGKKLDKNLIKSISDRKVSFKYCKIFNGIGYEFLYSKKSYATDDFLKRDYSEILMKVYEKSDDKVEFFRFSNSKGLENFLEVLNIESINNFLHAGDNQQKYKDLIKLADNYRTNNEFEKSLIHYKKAVELNVDNDYPTRQIAILEKSIEKNKLVTDANKKYKQDLDKYPSDYAMIYKLGLEQLNKAKESHNEANKIMDARKYKEALGNVYLLYEACIPYFSKVLELNPENSQSASVLKSLYYLLRNEKSEYAQKYIEFKQKYK